MFSAAFPLTVASADAVIDTSTWAFGTQNVGTSSSPQSRVLTNSDGSATISVSAASDNSDYSVSDDCSGSLGPGAQCNITVTFTPSVGGTDNGTLTITTDALNGNQTIPLTGAGHIPSPAVALSGSANFGTVRVNTTSATLSGVTLTNTGDATLTISSITASAPFSMVGNTCGGSRSAGTSCSISVTYSPTSTASSVGSVTVTSNAGSSPDSCGGCLSGTGGAPILTVSPSSLSFGNQGLNTSSGPKSILVRNTGNFAMVITSITTSGDFHQSKTCSSSLSAGGSCTVTITFRPTALGSRSGTTAIRTDGGNRNVALSGIGVAPSVGFNHAVLNFGDVRVNTTSAPQTVVMTNIGTQTLSISRISSSPSFSEGDTCTSTLAVGASCSIVVTFHPTAVGIRNGLITVSDSVGTQTIDLTGRGVFPAVQLKPGKVNFGNQPVGLNSPPKTITLTNSGTDTLSIKSISDSVNYSETDSCKAPIAAGGNCVINVFFTPTDYGERQGTISIQDDVGRQVVDLLGTGVTAASAGFGSGPNTPPYSPIPQSGFGGANTPPPQAAGPIRGGGHAISAPLIGVAGGGLLLIGLGGFGLFWLTRRKREWTPPPAPAAGEIPLMETVGSGEGFELATALTTAPAHAPPLPAPPAESADEAIAVPPVEPTPEEQPSPETEFASATLGTVIHPPKRSSRDRGRKRPVVPLLASIEVGDAEVPDSLLTRRPRTARPSGEDSFEHPATEPAPELEPVPVAAPIGDPAGSKQERRARGRKARREKERKPAPDLTPTPEFALAGSQGPNPLLGRIEEEMTELDTRTDQPPSSNGDGASDGAASSDGDRDASRA